ncbi:AAA family ATPase [Chitinispirillales bacterium ANBcel5]|uniref:ATP-binding protein n=1 Tax=Cellulosispirillum alkaliphilum TaxID=3039283 RepID=UPI002A4F8831|nr:AAA family ATPase [Chitinispirillales bacterium ANBcel5]
MKYEFSLSLYFKKSSSKNYHKAIGIANKFSDYLYNEKDESHLINLTIDEYTTKQNIFEQLYNVVSTWKGTAMLINSTCGSKVELNRINKIIECSTKNNADEKYCYADKETKEGWHCYHLYNISRYASENEWGYDYNKYWFDFGNFKTDSIWAINKDQLYKSIENEALEKFLYICPYFDFKNLNKIISNLPDEIDLDENDRFEIKYTEIDDGYTKEQIATGIKLRHSKEDMSNFGDRNESLIHTDKVVSETRFIPQVTFEEIGGLGDTVQLIREIIELPIKHPDVFKHLGIAPHTGIILYGPPGCGKTMVAKAIANEIKAHFIGIKGPELLSKFHGESENNIRKIFNIAHELQPAIIYFDEIDSIAQKRSGDETLRSESRIVNQLLSMIDGLDNFGNIRVLASTNRIELLDPAILRPGRFDYHIEIKEPTIQGCFEIFNKAVANMPLAPNIETSKISKALLGMTGADIAFVAREGAYNCLRRNVNMMKVIKTDLNIESDKLIITEDDFWLAIKKLKTTKDKQSKHNSGFKDIVSYN